MCGLEAMKTISNNFFFHVQFLTIQSQLFSLRSGDFRGRANDGEGELDIADIVVFHDTSMGSTSKHWSFHQKIMSTNPW